MKRPEFVPRLVAWEVTRNCNLNCVHCRAAATRGPYEGELSTEECLRVLREIRELGQPVIILTGGEPLLRPDIFELASYGTELGLRMVMAPNGTLITEEVTEKMKASGIQRVSISLDGATAEAHDSFRKMPGAFEGALRGIRLLKEAGIPFQINTTITEINLAEIPKVFELAVSLGA
ncbi:MAG TPA: radical SAM protein, partial [Thermodesulfatator sp.]|nr:radical SAM protein [Thermodesulfatator sp.]